MPKPLTAAEADHQATPSPASIIATPVKKVASCIVVNETPPMSMMSNGNTG